MNESTARAERYDLQTSPSTFYLWEVPQKPVAVRIPYELIERLEREAVESFRSVTSRGSEIGGLLIGSAQPGSPLVVSVAEFQLIECEYARGPLYRLSEADISRYQRAIEERGSKGAGVAGFFRTHTRKGVSLDPDDVAFLDATFREPHHIALLVRPFATKASTAGIFIREGGRFSGDASYLEFPFRAPGSEGKAPAEEPDPKPAPAGPAPTSSKAVVRGQIVPIASRRDISLPSGVVEDKPLAAPPPSPTASVAAPMVSPAEEKTPKTEEKARTDRPPVEKPTVKTAPPAAKVEKPVVKEPEKPAAKEVEKPAAPAPVAAAAPAVKPAPPVKPAPAVKPAPGVKPETQPEAAPKSTKGLKLVLAALATTALFVVLFVYPGFIGKSAKTPTLPQQDGSPLQLRVERTNGELLLTWNRDSDAIRGASKAVLAITDGEQHENVEMDLAQLRNGSIVYSPQGTDISFKMEVTGQGQNKTTSESVRVLRTRPSPLQDQNQAANAAKPNAAAASPSNKPADSTTPAPTTTPGTETPAPTEVSKPVFATRPFKAESLGQLGQRLRPTQSTDIAEAPTVGGPRISPTAIPGVNVNNVGPAPIAPPPAAPVAPPPTAEAKPAAKAGGQIQAAVLISKKDPEYPKLARQTGAKGIVRLTATVGKDGHVKSVKVISGHPMLQAAASDAVKQWIYKPTLLNGQPVETETEVVLNFVGDK
jgi:periplasmic protein TonB